MLAGLEVILGIIALFIGIALGYYVRKQKALSEINSAEARAQKIVNEAKAQEKETVIKAQEKALVIIEEAKREETRRYRELNEFQKRLEKRETTFSQKLLELQDKQQKLYDKVNQIEEAKEKIIAIRKEQLAKLEKIAQMTKDEAKEILMNNVEGEIKDALLSRVKKLEQESTSELEEKTKAMLAITMQRLAPTYTAEVTTTTVDLPNDEMKGRIIGREGRNIRAIENLTGVEIIVDDTPNVITISGFSMIRRHLAKRALEKLILDGRIHPTKIEDAIEEAKKELALDIKKAGEEAMYEVGVTGFGPKLVQI